MGARGRAALSVISPVIPGADAPGRACAVPSVFADQPSLPAGKMQLAIVLDPLGSSIGDPQPSRSNTGHQSGFDPFADPSFTWRRLACLRTANSVRNGPLAGTPLIATVEKLGANRIHLEVRPNASCPPQPACREALSKRRTETVSASASTQPKRTPVATHRSRSRDMCILLRWCGPARTVPAQARISND